MQRFGEVFVFAPFGVKFGDERGVGFRLLLASSKLLVVVCVVVVAFSSIVSFFSLLPPKKPPMPWPPLMSFMLSVMSEP